MNQNKRYHNCFQNQAMLPCAVIILLFTCFLGLTEFKDYNNHDRNNQSQSLKTSSSQPLSAQNFYKTRPRGLTAQEPIYKYAALTGLALLYPPGQSAFIYPSPTWTIFNNFGNAQKIRPPPIA